MNSSQRYLLFLLLALTGGSLIVFAAFYSVYSPAFKPLPPREGAEIKYPLPPPAPSVPGFHITKKDKNTFVVTWENLPEDTASLRIYRTPKKGEDGLWREIPIAPGTAGGGSAEIKLKPGEGSGDYEYRAEGVSGGGSGSGTSTGGTVTWTSSSTVPEAPPPPTPTSTSSSTSSGGTTGQTGSNPPSSPAPTSSAPTSTQTPPPENPTGTVYYSPDGQVSTTTQPSAANFGVQHTNRNIEIYWQNLPAATDQLVVYRSSASGGPWSQLLAQGSPDRIKGSIFLVDYTIDQGFYYRMEVRDSGSLLQSYGPVYLPPLE